MGGHLIVDGKHHNILELQVFDFVSAETVVVVITMMMMSMVSMSVIMMMVPVLPAYIVVEE